MPDRTISFQVTVPTDNGYIGRSCASSSCGKYFKIKVDDLRESMFCPYCGLQFSKDELMTEDQKAHFQAAAAEYAKEMLFGEIDEMFRDLARKNRGNKFVKIEHKSQRYRAKNMAPKYKESPVDSELTCGYCNCSFQVFGIFGYCPRCRNENLRIYDANFEIIRQEIESSSNKQRALRHAYSDFVSTFEQVAESRAKTIASERVNFQDLYETRKFFKKQSGKDVFGALNEKKIRDLQRVFLKRHVYEHNNGIIGEKYVKLMPEDREFIGQRALLSLEELDQVVGTLRQILDNIVKVTT